MNGAGRARWRNVPLPEPHLIGLGAAAVLQAVRSLPLHLPLWSRVAGLIIAVGGLVVAGWAVWAAADTRLDQPDRLVLRGPYRASRNPMYVGWTIAYLGLCLAAAAGWLLLLLPVVLATTHLVIRREERALTTRFGAAYQLYSAAVRRYL